MACTALDNLARRLHEDPTAGVFVETARALEVHGWRFGKTTRQTLVLATLDVERRNHHVMESESERERALLS
jgi:hypothetical protein